MVQKLGKRHNKKRNTALLYEFLIRHASNCIVNDQKEQADRTLSIVKKYFHKGSPLLEELKLFKTLLNTTVKSRESANRILSEVCKGALRVDVKKLDVQKSKIIKEINYTYKDENIYNYKIPHYTVCASVQTLFNNIRNKKTDLSSVGKIQLEETVSDHLLLEKNSHIAPIKKNNDYNKTIYHMIFNKFYEKYGNKLNENQKSFLIKYATYLITEDTEQFQKEIITETKKIKDALTNIKDENVKKDKELVNKLNECYDKFVDRNFVEVSEDSVVDLLQYMQLVNEVNSSDEQN